MPRRGLYTQPVAAAFRVRGSLSEMIEQARVRCSSELRELGQNAAQQLRE
jgi:hypothetical protein